MLLSYWRKFSVKKVRSGYGEGIISTKKSPTNALSHSDTSSLALILSAL